MGFVQNHKRAALEGLNGNLAVFLGAQLIHIVEKIPDHRFSQDSLHPCGHDTVNDRQQYQHGDRKQNQPTQKGEGEAVIGFISFRCHQIYTQCPEWSESVRGGGDPPLFFPEGWKYGP